MFSGLFQAKDKKNNQPTVQLPDTFAQDLMHLELEAEHPNVSVDTITRLLELYRVSAV